MITKQILPSPAPLMPKCPTAPAAGQNVRSRGRIVRRNARPAAAVRSWTISSTMEPASRCPSVLTSRRVRNVIVRTSAVFPYLSRRRKTQLFIPMGFVVYTLPPFHQISFFWRENGTQRAAILLPSKKTET